MTKTPRSARGGIAGPLFVFCTASGAAGAAFDFALGPQASFWVGAQPGAAAVTGAGAAVFAVLAAHLARLLLGRSGPEAKGGRGAGGHT